MATLADIYSAANTFKRKLADTVQNPVTSIEQMLGYANDRARNLNQMTYSAADELKRTGSLIGPAQQELSDLLAESYNPVGMTVYHGSPHIFERFDLSKIGTGEGAQAYGKGMYMAQSPNVAEEYRRSLAGRTDLNQQPSDPAFVHAVESFRQANYPLEKIPEEMKKAYKSITDKDIQLAIQATDKGGFYKVDLPDTHIRRMLDWDEPLKNQPTIVRKLAKSLGMDLNDLGGDLLAKVGKGEEGKQILEQAGIRGIKYLDEKSRWSPYQVEILHKGKPYATSEYATKEQAEQYAKEKQAEGFQTKHKMVGTRNFVVFDPNHLTILERNNQPIK